MTWSVSRKWPSTAALPVWSSALSTLCHLPKRSARGLKIDTPDQLASTLKRALAMHGPVVVGIPVDYRDNHRLMEMVHPNVLN